MSPEIAELYADWNHVKSQIVVHAHVLVSSSSTLLERAVLEALLIAEKDARKKFEAAYQRG